MYMCHTAYVCIRVGYRMAYSYTSYLRYIKVMYTMHHVVSCTVFIGGSACRDHILKDLFRRLRSSETGEVRQV